MTKVIYVHLNYNKFSFSKDLVEYNHVYGELPEYAIHSINQSKKLFDDVIILTDEDNKDDIESFYKMCSITYPHFSKNSFWFFTLARLFCVFNYVVKNKIEKFIHLEYDNLIYYNDNCLNNLPNGVYFTQVGPKIGSAGFLYSNSLIATNNFLLSLIKLIQMGEDFLANEIKSVHLYEMEMIDFLNINKFCQYLPLFPDDNYFDICKKVFDGASYGQYLGGTNNGDPAGWFGTHHHVGNKLQKNEIEITFHDKPYLKQNNEIFEIFNLHLHNKKAIKEFLL